MIHESKEEVRCFHTVFLWTLLFCFVLSIEKVRVHVDRSTHILARQKEWSRKSVLTQAPPHPAFAYFPRRLGSFGARLSRSTPPAHHHRVGWRRTQLSQDRMPDRSIPVTNDVDLQ